MVMLLRGLEALGRLSAISAKGDIFCYLFLYCTAGLRSVVHSDSKCVLPWIPVPNDERQQEQGSRSKSCTSKRSPARPLDDVFFKIRIYSHWERFFLYRVDPFSEGDKYGTNKFGQLSPLKVCQCPFKALLSSFIRKQIRKRPLPHMDSSSEKGPSNNRKMRRFRSSCSCVKYHPGLLFIRIFLYTRI